MQNRLDIKHRWPATSKPVLAQVPSNGEHRCQSEIGTSSECTGVRRFLSDGKPIRVQREHACKDATTASADQHLENDEEVDVHFGGDWDERRQHAWQEDGKRRQPLGTEPIGRPTRDADSDEVRV